MSTNKRSVLVVNLLYWLVAALLYPLSQLIPTGSGEPPKILSLLIPLFFIGLAGGSTLLMSRALHNGPGNEQS